MTTERASQTSARRVTSAAHRAMPWPHTSVLCVCGFKCGSRLCFGSFSRFLRAPCATGCVCVCWCLCGAMLCYCCFQHASMMCGEAVLPSTHPCLSLSLSFACTARGLMVSLSFYLFGTHFYRVASLGGTRAGRMPNTVHGQYYSWRKRCFPSYYEANFPGENIEQPGSVRAR